MWICSLTLPFLVVPLADATTDTVLRVPRPIAGDGAEGRAEVVVRGPWGAGPGEFGKVDEASRPGPMDFAVSGDTLYVLDTVNARVQLFDLSGAFRGEVPIGTRTADFICVDGSGEITVLDAFVRREFKTFSADGRLLSHARVPPAVGLPSAIFADGERVWIEERHSRVHELGITRDRPGAVASVVGELTGRPLGEDGYTILARKKDAHAVELRVNSGREVTQRLSLEFERRLASIVTLESDDCDCLYLAVACLLDNGDSWKTDLTLVVVTSDGELAAVASLPNTYVTDHYRKLFVTPAGYVVQLQTTEDEVRFVRWTLREDGSEGGSR